MTAQEKKETGVYKLTEPQKASLQQWIDNHYEKRAAPLATKAAKSRPVVSEVLQNGRYLRLSDGSLWNVRSEDTPISQSWITAVELIISPSSDPDYPSKLTNSLTGSSVRAKKVEKISPLK